MSVTGQQLQRLIDRYELDVDLEGGTVVVSRKRGALKAATVAKMLGMGKVPTTWVEEEGRVRGL